MNAYLITLQLFERSYEDDPWEESDSKIGIITVAKSLDAASKFVPEAYMKADQTDKKEFEWQVVAAEKLEGLVALPPFKNGVAPRT